MPDVSVVIPTRDRPELLAQTLTTVLWQRDVDLEVVVVDDGSETPLVGRVAELSDPRVDVVRNDDSHGVSGARNRGIERATGDWVAFCDDDDLWAPDKLADQIAAATHAGSSWVYAGDVNVDDRLRIIGGGPPPSPEAVMADLTHYNAVPSGASNVVVRADVLAAVGGFDSALTTSEDWDLWLRLARAGPPACVPRPWVALRIHSGNASNNMTRLLEELEVVAARHGVSVDLPRHLRWAAWSALGQGRRAEALRFYARAVAKGDVASAGRMAITLVRPSMARNRSFARQKDDPWLSEADRWLGELNE